jgi:alkaline phosphatase
VQVALNFAATHPRTLIVTGADHECCGLSVEGVDDADESGDGESAEDGPFEVQGSAQPMVLDWTTTSHTAVDVPFTAAGRGAAAFRGVIDNTEVYRGLAGAFGFEAD